MPAPVGSKPCSCLTKHDRHLEEFQATRQFPALLQNGDKSNNIVLINCDEGGSTSSTRPSTYRQQKGSPRLFDPDLTRSSVSEVNQLSQYRQRIMKTSMQAQEAFQKEKEYSSPRSVDQTNNQNVRPPFSPCNPTKAKSAITVTQNRFLSSNPDYQASRRSKTQGIGRPITKPPIFMPASASNAREAIRVNYYFNSPDADAIEAERRFTRETAKKNLAALKEREKEARRRRHEEAGY